MTDYSVAITLKDNGILKRLENLSKNGIMAKMSDAGGSSSSGGGGIKKLESLGLGQLAKLTGIGLGVGSLVHLITKSSGILQGTFKLMETSMMLIFKPIGDFIGLALRPVVMMLLTSFILPFYNHVRPLFVNYGTAIGDFFKANPALALAGIGTALGLLIPILEYFTGKLTGDTSKCPDCSKTHPNGGCINICKETQTAPTNPTGIPTGFPQFIPVPTGGSIFDLWSKDKAPTPPGTNTPNSSIPNSTNLFDSWNKPSPSLFDSWNKKKNPDIMGQIGEAAATSTTSASNDWSLVSNNSADIAATAFNIAMAWKKAEDTLKGAVSTLESWANSLSSKGPGMGEFKIPIRPRSITASWSQGIADTLP